jgi:hypothetical protein
MGRAWSGPSRHGRHREEEINRPQTQDPGGLRRGGSRCVTSATSWPFSDCLIFEEISVHGWFGHGRQLCLDGTQKMIPIGMI